MRFYLGTHQTGWLGHAGVPLFVSHRRLSKRRAFPRAAAPWALDSGGFTELNLHGRWTVPAAEYARAIARYSNEIGSLDWAAPQDWMCEPAVLAATGGSIEEHQRRTIESVLELRALGAPVVPVLQGWEPQSYLRHADDYARAGFDLRAEPIVGLGTVCRRQGMAVAATIVRSLAAGGIKLHGFGFKTTGLRACGDALGSADSLAWSYNARRNPPMAGHKHKSCSSCLPYALAWRDRLLGGMRPRSCQLSLFGWAA